MGKVRIRGRRREVGIKEMGRWVDEHGHNVDVRMTKGIT